MDVSKVILSNTMFNRSVIETLKSSEKEGTLLFYKTFKNFDVTHFKFKNTLF